MESSRSRMTGDKRSLAALKVCEARFTNGAARLEFNTHIVNKRQVQHEVHFHTVLENPETEIIFSACSIRRLYDL